MTILVGPVAFCTVNLNPNVPVSKRLSPATNIRFVVGESPEDPPPPQPAKMNVDARAIPKSLVARPKDFVFYVVTRAILASPWKIFLFISRFFVENPIRCEYSLARESPDSNHGFKQTF